MVSDLSFVYCHFNHCYTDLMIKMYSTKQTNVTPDKLTVLSQKCTTRKLVSFFFCLSIFN